jgi:hypothetical protein
MRKDGQTDRHNAANSRFSRNFAAAPEKKARIPKNVFVMISPCKHSNCTRRQPLTQESWLAKIHLHVNLLTDKQRCRT